MAAVAACTVLAFRQVRLWRSDFELFGQAVENSPGNYFAHEAVGRAHMLAGSPREAAAEFREALRIKPDYSLARYNLGVVVEQLGDPGEAQRQYEEAIRSDPRNTYALTNLGTLLHRQGRLTEAAARYRQALSLNPDDAVAWISPGCWTLPLGITLGPRQLSSRRCGPIRHPSSPRKVLPASELRSGELAGVISFVRSQATSATRGGCCKKVTFEKTYR